MKPVRVEPEAQTELSAAAQYYEDRVAGLGDDFLDVAFAAIDRVAELPHAFTRVADLPEELPVRSARLGRFPYHVVFLEHA